MVKGPSPRRYPMVVCTKCRHSNFDGFANCSRCGAPLAAGAPGAPGIAAPGGGMAGGGGGGGMDEYQRMMADRAAKQIRNRSIVVAVGLVVVGVGGFWTIRERKKTAAAQVVLEAGGRFAEKELVVLGVFWFCVLLCVVVFGFFLCVVL